MTNLYSILKSRDISLPTKIHMAFPVVMCGCDSWTVKKAEHQRTDAFKLWCWRRLVDSKEIKLVNPKGNQPWIFIGRTDAEAPILWPSDVKSWLIRKDPDAGKDWGQEEKRATGDEDWMASWTQRTWVWASSGRWWKTGKPGLLQFMGLQSWTWLSDWITATPNHITKNPGPRITDDTG